MKAAILKDLSPGEVFYFPEDPNEEKLVKLSIQLWGHVSAFGLHNFNLNVFNPLSEVLVVGCVDIKVRGNDG